MPKLTRQTQKVFSSNADNDMLAVFGSMKTGTPAYSRQLSVLQSSAYLEGWNEAILNDKAPYLEEMNAVQYGLSYQSAYLLQEGVPEYDSSTTYYIGSVVKSLVNGIPTLYYSVADNNTGNQLSNSTYWRIWTLKDRNIGEIIPSVIPLQDAGLHLLDGSILSGDGIYSQFVEYIEALYNAGTASNCFTTEENWQQTNSLYGAVGKFVWDATNNTVRLPKLTGFIEGTMNVNSLGSLNPQGLPAHTHNYSGTTSTVGNHSHSPIYLEGSNADLGDPGTLVITNAGQDNGKRTIKNSSTGAAGSHSHTFSGTSEQANNGIYGASSKVQPQSIYTYYYIVVANSVKTNITVDIDEIATDLNTKTDISTATKASLPSNTAVNVTMQASGGTYTAPADGMFAVTTDGTAKLVNNTSTYNDDFNMLVKQGDVVTITYTGTTSLKFIYAEGSEP